MCSTWLATVLGEITSNSATLLLGIPRASSLSTSISRWGQAGRPFPPAGDAVPGGAQHSLNHIRFKAPGAGFRS
jgi:hypothetical protein